MKRKWSLRLGAAVLCAVLLGSCGSTAAAPAESTAPADPLTGQQLLYPEQRAAAVVVENTTGSTTQWGIGSASVVLEALTESGSSTELCLVYPALEAMPVVGPVTRGQDLYWRLLSGQQVLPIQCGSSAYAKRYLEYYNLRAVDAQEVGRNAFVSTGYSWNSTPLWRTSGKAVASVLDSLSISAAVNQSASGNESETPGVLPALLPQRDTGHLPDANAADAVKVTVNFQSGGATGFVYDDALATYGMLHADGTPQLDANTGTQAAFDNLLILYSGSSLRDDGRTLDYDLSMGGGVWLNGGHLWQITWTQGTQSTLALYDSNGKPLNLPAGRSYIALLSSLAGQELLVQNSTGEALVGEIWDEHDEVTEDFRKQSDGSWIVLGSAGVDDLYERLGLPEDEDIDSNTVNGLVQEKTCRLPKVGDRFTLGSYDGVVTRTAKRRVTEVRLTPAEKPDSKKDEEEKGHFGRITSK